MRKFDYSFLKNLMVPISFVQMAQTIYSLKSISDEKKKNYPDLFSSLQKIAIVQSVKGSNAIEGIITTDERIEAIVNKSSAPLNHSEMEIAGYRDALSLIHQNHGDMSLDETTILNLHKILLSQTNLSYGGSYKKEDNVIRETYADGTSRIRFSPVSTKDTPEAMEQWIIAYLEARDDAGINQLLLIPCVILDFLCIHPFRDGNGRMSRLLTLLLLYKADFDISKYISFEEQVNNMRGRYYEDLKKSSDGWHENRNDYVPFIENFMYALYLCYRELDKRFLTLSSGKVSKKQRIEQIVLSAFIPVSKKEIQDLLPDVSVSTIEAVLGEMMREGRIIKVGEARNSRYKKA